MDSGRGVQYVVFEREDLSLYKIKELENSVLKNAEYSSKAPQFPTDMASNQRISHIDPEVFEKRPRNVNFFLNALNEFDPENKKNCTGPYQIKSQFYVENNAVFYEINFEEFSVNENVANLLNKENKNNSGKDISQSKIIYKLKSNGSYEFVRLECAPRFVPAVEKYFTEGNEMKPALEKAKKILEDAKDLTENDFESIRKHIKRNVVEWSKKYPDKTNFYLVSLNKKDNLTKDMKERARNNDIPILIKRGNHYSVYGCCDGKWEERKLDPNEIYPVTLNKDGKDIEQNKRRDLIEQLNALDFSTNMQEISHADINWRVYEKAEKVGHKDSKKIFKEINIKILKDITRGLPDKVRNIMINSYELRADLFSGVSEDEFGGDKEGVHIGKLFPSDPDLINQNVVDNITQLTNAFQLSSTDEIEYPTQPVFLSLFQSKPMEKISNIPEVVAKQCGSLSPFPNAIGMKMIDMNKPKQALEIKQESDTKIPQQVPPQNEIILEKEEQKEMSSESQQTASQTEKINETKAETELYIKEIIMPYWEGVKNEILNLLAADSASVMPPEEMLNKLAEISGLQKKLERHIKLVDLALEDESIETNAVEYLSSLKAQFEVISEKINTQILNKLNIMSNALVRILDSYDKRFEALNDRIIDSIETMKKNSDMLIFLKPEERAKIIDEFQKNYEKDMLELSVLQYQIAQANKQILASKSIWSDLVKKEEYSGIKNISEIKNKSDQLAQAGRYTFHRLSKLAHETDQIRNDLKGFHKNVFDVHVIEVNRIKEENRSNENQNAISQIEQQADKERQANQFNQFREVFNKRVENAKRFYIQYEKISDRVKSSQEKINQDILTITDLFDSSASLNYQSEANKLNKLLDQIQNFKREYLLLQGVFLDDFRYSLQDEIKNINDKYSAGKYFQADDDLRKRIVAHEAKIEEYKNIIPNSPYFDYLSQCEKKIQGLLGRVNALEIENMKMKQEKQHKINKINSLLSKSFQLNLLNDLLKEIKNNSHYQFLNEYGMSHDKKNMEIMSYLHQIDKSENIDQLLNAIQGKDSSPTLRANTGSGMYQFFNKGYISTTDEHVSLLLKDVINLINDNKKYSEFLPKVRNLKGPKI